MISIWEGKPQRADREGGRKREGEGEGEGQRLTVG
jgi:hypothetical protein